MTADSTHIGLFGGSFDPPHLGHFICARTVAERLNLSKVIVMPTAVQPFKPEGSIANIDFRLKMIESAIADDSLFESSKIEADRGGTSYTIDTLYELRKVYPSDRFKLTLILGVDSMLEFDRWKSPDEILNMTRVAVMSRDGSFPEGSYLKWRHSLDLVTVPHIGISSTMIRERIKLGLPVNFMVGKAVAKLIEEFAPYYL